jgi:O-acetyl-ADP-ribose deacetylase (regulator of RNase III)
MSEAVADTVTIHGGTVRLVQSDITLWDADAFVFYAQPDLQLGSGFGTAVSVRGGPSVQKELEELAPVETGQAVVTTAGKLKANFIVHAVGPRFQEEDIESKLRDTVVNSLQAAEQKGVKRIALPAMGAGFYGIPLDVCARVMLQTIKEYLLGETDIQEVVICVTDRREYLPFESQLRALQV